MQGIQIKILLIVKVLLKTKCRIDFGLLLTIHVTKHRIHTWIFKNKNKTKTNQ